MFITHIAQKTHYHKYFLLVFEQGKYFPCSRNKCDSEIVFTIGGGHTSEIFSWYIRSKRDCKPVSTKGVHTRSFHCRWWWSWWLRKSSSPSLSVMLPLYFLMLLPYDAAVPAAATALCQVIHYSELTGFIQEQHRLLWITPESKSNMAYVDFSCLCAQSLELKNRRAKGIEVKSRYFNTQCSFIPLL